MPQHSYFNHLERCHSGTTRNQKQDTKRGINSIIQNPPRRYELFYKCFCYLVEMHIISSIVVGRKRDRSPVSYVMFAGCVRNQDHIAH
jgi:hypothetical protein